MAVSVPRISVGGRIVDVLAVINVNESGEAVAGGGVQQTVTLIDNNVVSDPQEIFGGDYVWTVTGTFGGASVQLQALGPDGVTYQNIGAAKTSPDSGGGTGVGIGSNARVRATVTGGSPSGIFAALSRLP